MILRKTQIALLVALVSLGVSFAEDPPSKNYDTNDWIPIAQPEAPPIPEKKAQARVLNLADPPQKNFFPEDNVKPQQQFQQYLRETTVVNPYAVRGQQQQYVQPQTVAVPVRDQPYRFEIAQVKAIPQKVVDDIQSQQQYYLQAQPIRQHFPAETQFIMRPIPTSVLQQPVEQAVPQLTRPKVQYLMQAQQPYVQQPQQYHTIPQEYLNAPFVPQQEIYDPQYHTLPVSHQVSPFKVKPALNKTKTYIARPVAEQPLPPPKQKEEKENIQLVYVPLESLKQNNEPISYQRPQLAAPKPPPPPPPRITSHRQQQQIKNIETDFVKQALDAHKLQLQFQPDPAPSAYTVPQIYSTPITYSTTSTTTTRRPTLKKRKPHQPPLAVYMGGEGGVDVTDVLAVLKDAKSIDVQDSFGPHSPQVFVGPSSLEAPDGYAKFELPYLSNIDNNRVERKVEQLPFFVAPLSYKAPSGYSKIPLPSPHVGSVVVSTKANLLHEKLNPTLPTPILRPQTQYDYRQYYEEKPMTTYVSAPTTTTTTSPPPSRTSARPRPVNQVVNQYEIDQINNQFIPPTQFQYESFPISKYQEYDVASKEEQQYTPVRSTTHPPKPTPTISTQKYYSSNPTQNSFVESSDEVTGKYTVLEEYNANTKSSTPNYDQYNEQEQYYGTASPQPIYTRSSPRPTPNNQHSLSQDVMDYQILRARPTEEAHKTRYKTVLVPVTSTERSQPRQTAKPLLRPQVKPGDFYLDDSDVQVSPKYKDSNEDQTQYRDAEQISNRPTPQSTESKQYLSDAYYNQGLDPQKIDDYYNLPSLLPPVSQSLPGLINELQDQSLKSLLVPALLAPTTSKNVRYENKEQEYVEVSSVSPPLLASREVSTEATLPETTTRKNRGRQRGNRYTTASSVASDTTRRSVARGRRPYTSRTREDSVSSTTEYSTESRKTVPINRSRFRTRGRPDERSTSPPIEEAASSTLRGHSINALNSYQIEEQNTRSNLPSVKYEEQYVINNYQPVYGANNEPGAILEVIRQTPRQQYEEVTEAAKSKARSRVRSRTRPTTTAVPQTEKSVEDSKEADYGFIRVPNFKKPSDDSRETQKYSSTYVSSTARPQIQYPEEGVTARPKEIRYFIQEQISPSSTPIYFIGEIRPKYQPSSSTSRVYESTQELIEGTDRYVATTPSEYSTEPVTSKSRGRVRVAGRVSNEEVSIKPIRTRTRGKTHYKPPQSLTNKKSSEDIDVEGGNYPELYLKSKENYTPRPSFQITVDPSDDQVPHSSIYQPKYLPHSPENPGVLNELPFDLKQSNIDQYGTEPTPTALPYVAFVRTEDESAEDISTERLVDITQDTLNILQDVSPTQSSSFEDTTHVEEITKTFKKPYGKRRGVWKLVKARPVEVFEGAESQSLSSNKNQIQMNVKPTGHMYQVTEESERNTNPPDSTTNINPQTTSEESSTLTEAQQSQKSESLFDSLYEMFGIAQTQDPTAESTNNATEVQAETEKVGTTTTTEKVDTEDFIITEDADDTTTPKEIQPPKELTQATAILIIESSTESPQKEEEEIQSTTEQPMSYVTPMSLHMWTSTSTEVSHETEICYKGKCVKSKDSK